MIITNDIPQNPSLSVPPAEKFTKLSIMAPFLFQEFPPIISYGAHAAVAHTMWNNKDTM